MRTAYFIRNRLISRTGVFILACQWLLGPAMLLPSRLMADDCGADKSRLEDCLRSDGYAQGISTTINVIGTVLVNGAAIQTVVLGTRTVDTKPGEPAPDPIKYALNVQTQDNKTTVQADGPGWPMTGVVMNPYNRPLWQEFMKAADSKGSLSVPLQGKWETPSKTYQFEKPILYLQPRVPVTLKDVTCTGSIDDKGRAIVSFGGDASSAAEWKAFGATSPDPSHLTAVETLDRAVDRICSFGARNLKVDTGRIKSTYTAYLDKFFGDMCGMTGDKYTETHARRQYATLQLANMMQATRISMVSSATVTDLYLSAMDEFTGILFALSLNVILKIREKINEAKAAASEAAARGAATNAAEEALAAERTLIQQLKDKLTAAKDALTRFLEERTNLLSQLKALKDQIADLVEKVAKAKTRLDEFSKQIVDLDKLKKLIRY